LSSSAPFFGRMQPINRKPEAQTDRGSPETTVQEVRLTLNGQLAGLAAAISVV
jgi:hypothetical protein